MEKGCLCQLRPPYVSRYSDSVPTRRSGDRIPVAERFTAPVQNALGPSQPPIQWVPVLSRVKAARALR